MIVIGIIVLFVGLFFWVSSLWQLIHYKVKLQATISPLPSSMYKQYPYRVQYTYNGVTCTVDKRRGGFPLIGKRKIILIDPQTPEKLYFLVDVIFNQVFGLFFLFLSFCWFVICW